MILTNREPPSTPFMGLSLLTTVLSERRAPCHMSWRSLVRHCSRSRYHFIPFTRYVTMFASERGHSYVRNLARSQSPLLHGFQDTRLDGNSLLLRHRVPVRSAPVQAETVSGCLAAAQLHHTSASPATIVGSLLDLSSRSPPEHHEYASENQGCRLHDISG